jgi:hypothetical protein
LGEVRVIVERWENGVLIESWDDGATAMFPPLSGAGALATLLAVIGTITVQEAANVERVPIEHIEHEALAWAVAASAP